MPRLLISSPKEDIRAQLYVCMWSTFVYFILVAWDLLLNLEQIWRHQAPLVLMFLSLTYSTGATCAHGQVMLFKEEFVYVFVYIHLGVCIHDSEKKVIDPLELEL